MAEDALSIIRFASTSETNESAKTTSYWQLLVAKVVIGRGAYLRKGEQVIVHAEYRWTCKSERCPC